MNIFLIYANGFGLRLSTKTGRGAGLGGSTYRPRSVSSLLILLRAMFLEVCVFYGVSDGDRLRERTRDVIVVVW